MIQSVNFISSPGERAAPSARPPSDEPSLLSRSNTEERSPQQTLRVLHASSWKTTCGIADYCANLVQSLESVGIQSEIFRLNPEQTRDRNSQELFELMDEFVDRAKQFDIVHVQHEFGLFMGKGLFHESFPVLGRALDGLRAANIPVVITFHTEPLQNLPYPPFAIRRSYVILASRVYRMRRLWKESVANMFRRGSTGTCGIVHSGVTKADLVRSGFGKDRVRVIPHAIVERPSHQWSDRKAEAKQKMRLAPDAKVLSIFGFVARYKGAHFAAGLLPSLPENYHLVIIGGSHPDNLVDNTFQTLTEMKDREPYRGRLHLTGYADRETIDLCQGATDICLAPYLAETKLSASGAIAWALTSGRPVIASRIAAFTEVVRSSDCMRLVTPEDSEAWIRDIQNLANDGAAQQRLVANARQYSQSLSWKNTARVTLDLYQEVIGSNRSPAR
ncbi:MAG: glycosyltransferase [Phycisphaerales bacterium]